MTLEILTKSAAELEAMSTAELEAYFEPYLNVTRPERQDKEIIAASKSQAVKNKSSVENSDAYKKARAIAAQMGLKI